METLSAAIEAREFDRVKKGGYDEGQVDRFMARAAGEALALERKVATAHAKIQTLERYLGETRDMEDAVGAAFVAAADVKNRIIDEAERRAEEILDQARAEASDLSRPHAELEKRFREVDELMAGARAARREADEEAERLLDAARARAERVIAEARQDALTAMADTKKEAEDWIHRTRAEHQRVALMLRGLKAAVRDMLDEAAERSEAIGLVLGEDKPPASVRLPD
jgi:DivIVA domain-containing protein